MNRRRAFIGRALLAGGISLALRAPIARAAKLAKADVQYQERPKDGKDCDDCMHFLPGPIPSCKVVEGAISPHGYCLAFTRK
jgi:hypothetical protein